MRKNKRHSVGRVVGGLFLGLYVVVALLNFTVVQSYIGAAVGSHFSKEWGGKVRIGAMHFSPISHLILDDIELISPTNDTIFCGELISCRFKRFPFNGEGLKIDRVYLRNGRYHFASIQNDDGTLSTNLQYIIDYFAPTEPREEEEPKGPFSVEVGELRLRNIDYIQDLPTDGPRRYPDGVDIPHMRYYGTTAYFRNVHVIGDSVNTRIVSFSTTEASGLQVVDLSADVVVSRHCIRATNFDLQTGDSRVFMDAVLEYPTHIWMGKDYCNNVVHDVVLKEGTELNMRDAAYWAPTLWGVDCKMDVQGHVYGPVSDIHAEDFTVDFGQSSHISLDAAMRGLPNINVSHVDADIHQLHTNYDDLTAVRLPKGEPLSLPDMVRQMCVIDLEASLHGDMKDCQAEFATNTLIGDMEGTAHLAYDSALHDYTYMGDIDSRTLGVRSLLPNEWVSRTGLHLSFQGNGFDPNTMEASVEGRLYNTNFKGNDLERTTLSADLSGRVLRADIEMADSLIDLDLSATANLATHAYTADIDLNHAYLTALHLVPSDSALCLTTDIHANLQGDNLNNMVGTLAVENTHCLLGSRKIDVDNVSLTSEERNGLHRLTLNSDWLTAIVRGYFQYSDIPLVAREFCDRYMPTYFNPYRLADSVDLTSLANANFNIDMTWQDSNGTFRNIMPDIEIANGTSFHGIYNYGEALKMVFRSDKIAINDIALNEVGFNSGTQGDNYQMHIRAGALALGERNMVENVNLTTDLGTSLSTLAIKWDDNPTSIVNEGDLEFFLSSSAEDNKIMIANPNFYVMGEKWNIVCPNGIYFNNKRILVENLKVYGLGQSVTLKANIAHEDDDVVKMAFDDFNLGQLCAMLMPDGQLAVEGALDGMVNMRGLNKTPYIDANLTVDGCGINGIAMGDIDIKSNYKSDSSKLLVDMISTLDNQGTSRHPVELHGDLMLGTDNPALNLDLSLSQLNMAAAQPLLATVASDLKGVANGHIRLTGTPKSPYINGIVDIDDGRVRLIPTGVTYTFADSLSVKNNTLALNNFALRDPQGNTARVSGTASLAQSGLRLDMGISTDRITVLDKSAGGDSFYGRLLTSAQGTIQGPVDKLDIAVNATVLNGSELYVPISNKKEISENEFITFVQTNRTQRPTVAPTPAKSNNLNLLLNLAVTPGMKLHLPMDFAQLAANVTAVGRGDIKVSIRNGSAPDILGDYQFSSGNLSLSLLQLITKNFDIEEGSTLNFPGDINDTRFNINAAYNLRANLATLMGSSSDLTGNDSYVPIQDVISLSGTMQDPTVKFDIRLPNSEQNVVDQVFSYIDKNDELEMLNQSLSLLVFGRFAQNGTNNDENAAEGINGISLLTSSAGSIVSSLVKVVDVDFNYQAATANKSGQFDVGISKQWNKLYFESTFGYGNANSGLDFNTENILMGDVEMGYKFTPYFNFYGFHRTNTSYYTRTELPYKQGIGVKLTKDFDSLAELFPWLRKKEKDNKATK